MTKRVLFTKEFEHEAVRLAETTGHNQRSRIETQMGKWKTVIGSKLKARNFDNQKTDAQIVVRVLNRMTELGRPQSRRVA